MSLDQKRQYLQEQQSKKLVRYKNRAYIQSNLMLLKDYIAEKIKSFEFIYRNKGYKVKKQNIDTITDFIFKAKNKQQERDRELNDLWEQSSSLAVVPQDTVIDTSSKFAYQYNYRYGISSKYFLLKTSGINSKEDIEDNRLLEPQRLISVKTKRHIEQKLVYPKIEIIRYYYKGKQIKKENAFEKVITLKKNVEEVTYRENKKLKTIYIDTKTDKRVFKKNAFKIVIRLKKGVKVVKSKVRGKKQVYQITKKKSIVREVKYTKVNYFAQTYKNYLPYFLFVRIAKKEVMTKTGATYLEDRVKFYISTYIDKNGNVKYIPSKIKNGRDITANSDMVGNVIMPQLIESRTMQELFLNDGRIREKSTTDTAFIDKPVMLLFFVGQKNLSRPKKYRQSIKDEEIIDIQNENDTGKMRDTSSLDINENKDYLVDIKTQQQLKQIEKKENINLILSNNEDLIKLNNRIELLNNELDKEKYKLKYLKEKRIKTLLLKDLNKVISLLDNSINQKNKQIEYINDNNRREEIIKEVKYLEDLRYEIQEINRENRLRFQNRYLEKFNNDRLNKLNYITEKIDKLEEKRNNIIRREENKLQQEENKKVDTIKDTEEADIIDDGDLKRVQKVNLLKRYYNKIVNEINTDNPLEIKK